MYLLSAAAALLDELSNRDQLPSAQFLFSIGLCQSLLNILVARLRNFYGHVERENAGFNGGDEPFLPFFQKSAYHVDVFDANADFGCNFAVSVAPTT